jgi:MerR family copper efflux transcriptional regulator
MVDKLRIGELAERAGVTTRTIRYYESRGLLGPPDRPGGFRHYSEDALVRLKKIDALKKLGLSLDEISSVIELYFKDPTGIKGKKKLLGILQGHLLETERKLEDLEQFRAELRANIARVGRAIEDASRAKA